MQIWIITLEGSHDPVNYASQSEEGADGILERLLREQIENLKQIGGWEDQVQSIEKALDDDGLDEAMNIFTDDVGHDRNIYISVDAGVELED